jgi:hypothetical protein
VRREDAGEKREPHFGCSVSKYKQRSGIMGFLKSDNPYFTTKQTAPASRSRLCVYKKRFVYMGF